MVFAFFGENNNINMKHLIHISHTRPILLAFLLFNMSFEVKIPDSYHLDFSLMVRRDAASAQNWEYLSNGGEIQYPQFVKPGKGEDRHRFMLYTFKLLGENPPQFFEIMIVSYNKTGKSVSSKSISRFRNGEIYTFEDELYAIVYQDIVLKSEGKEIFRFRLSFK
jgi:hypothetical protein